MKNKNNSYYMLISIAVQFSRFPAGRNRNDGPYSGEAFRDSILLPAMRIHDKVIVNLDGTLGFGSSWLEAAFQGVQLLFPKCQLIFESETDSSLVSESQLYAKKANINCLIGGLHYRDKR